MAETTTTTAAKVNEAKSTGGTAVAPVKAPKVGETVHLVHHTHRPGARFKLEHAEAEVTKVHPKGKSVDLIVHADDPKDSLVITGSPCDPAGTQPDSWHFPEAANPAA